MVAADAIKNLKKELPPVFSRQAVPKLIPGIFSSQTLSNFSSQSEGPPVVKIGRKVWYQGLSLIYRAELRLVEKEG